MGNKLIISAAGSGKTTLLVKEALEILDDPVLITTFTEANEQEIRSKFIEINGYIPKNVTIQTWFSLLIKHGIKPYQSVLFDFHVNGMLLVNKQSGFRYKTPKGFPVFWGESNFNQYYFTDNKKIYSDKLSKLVIKINEKSEGKIIDRLINIYPNIFIDESQDLAGYDLDIIRLLSESPVNLIMVCDPRQVTYLTHNESKYRKYRNGLLEEFIKDKCSNINFEIDNHTLSHSHRCNEKICVYSNKLYSTFKPCFSAQDSVTGHDGIFLVKNTNIKKYLETYNPVQLRWNSLTKNINLKYTVNNLGLSKGLSFDRVLIYPTSDMIKWMKNHDHKFSDEARAKFYVGLTRARYSVGIVCEENDDYILENIEIYK